MVYIEKNYVKRAKQGHKNCYSSDKTAEPLPYLVTMENGRLNGYRHKSALRLSVCLTFPYFSFYLLADREIEIKMHICKYNMLYLAINLTRIHIAVIQTSTFCETKATANLSWYWELNLHYVK